MRKLLALSCVLAAACGGSAAFKDQARDAMPNSSGVAVGPQEAQASQSNALTADGSSQALVGADPWYNATVAFAFSINAGTAWTLGAVEAVTATEPTSCTADSCTWGPGSGALDPNEYKLTVTQGADASFDWVLSGRSKADATAQFITLISGNAVPSGQRHRGSGTFTINLDNARQISGHVTDQGTIDITYSNVGPAHVHGGDMEIAWHDVTHEERDDIHSRWKADGSGRADVTVVKPLNPNAQFSNCWSVAASGFVTVYGQLSGTGSVSACSYADAAFGTNINTPE